MSDSKFNPVTDRIILSLDRVHVKLDNLDSRIDSIDRTLVKNGADIEYHIRRSDLLEEAIASIRSDIRPMQRHVNLIEAATKIFAAVSAAVVFIAAVLKIFGAIK